MRENTNQKSSKYKKFYAVYVCWILQNSAYFLSFIYIIAEHYKSILFFFSLIIRLNARKIWNVLLETIMTGAIKIFSWFNIIIALT